MEAGFARNGRAVYIVDGARTPFLKAQNKPGHFTGSDLAVACGRTLLLRQPFLPEEVEEVIIGCAMPNENEANIARVVALRLGCGKKVPAWTVQRNCASGLQAIDDGASDIAFGRHDLVLVGGTDAMSQAPLLLNRAMVNWLAMWYSARGVAQKTRLLLQLRPHFFAPVIALLHGLTDPIVGYSMGQTAEILARRFHITRSAMDEYAVISHQRVVNAQVNNRLTEIEPLYDTTNHIYTEDTGVRKDSSLEKLSTLKPFFDKPYGQVTAGNSSQVTDGAAMLLLASEVAVKKYNLPVVARIRDVCWVGVEPAEMGLGPVHAIAELLQKNQLTLAEIDFFEINEAFAAQVLACVAALQSSEYCREEFGLEQPIGKIPLEKLNVDGGAIALGHPIGASGARISLHLAHVLQRHQARFGIASLCIGGGQGGAMLIERVVGVS
jgi:acetyl-CoA C-acetyltransferase